MTGDARRDGNIITLCFAPREYRKLMNALDGLAKSYGCESLIARDLIALIEGPEPESKEDMS